MLYCEKCNCLSEVEDCPTCDNKKLRQVNDEDFCFLIECEEFFGKMLIEALENDGIKCAFIPVGNGVRSHFGLTLGNYRIYVPYKHYENAQNTLDYFTEEDSSDDLKKTILENIEKWSFTSPAAQKKIRKKFKLNEDANIIEFVKEKVEQAQSVEDVGLMVDGEHGLLVKCESINLWFSSDSFKISL